MFRCVIFQLSPIFTKFPQPHSPRPAHWFTVHSCIHFSSIHASLVGLYSVIITGFHVTLQFPLCSLYSSFFRLVPFLIGFCKHVFKKIFWTVYICNFGPNILVVDKLLFYSKTSKVKQLKIK